MPKSLKEVLARKSPERQAKIKADAKRMIKKEKAKTRRRSLASTKDQKAPFP